MYVKSHVDVPSLLNLARTMREEGGRVEIEVLTHGALVPPKEWGQYLRALAGGRIRDTTERAFAGL